MIENLTFDRLNGINAHRFRTGPRRMGALFVFGSVNLGFCGFFRFRAIGQMNAHTHKTVLCGHTDTDRETRSYRKHKRNRKEMVIIIIVVS